MIKLVCISCLMFGIFLFLTRGCGPQHLHSELLLGLRGLPLYTKAGRHDGHDARPPDAHHLGAYEQHQARRKEAAAGDGEEHEEGGLGVAPVVPPDHEGRVVRRVVAGEPQHLNILPTTLAGEFYMMNQ